MPLSKSKYEEWKKWAKKTGYHKKRYQKRRNKLDKWALTKPKTPEENKIYRAYARKNLTNWWIKNLINSKLKLKFGEIPIEMVELKREMIILFRLIKIAKGVGNERTY